MASQEQMTEFQRRLAETIAWCAGRASLADPKSSLRTPALGPRAFGDFTQPQEERQAIVDAVVEKRAQLLRAENRYPECMAEDLAGGRLLIYGIEESVWDGVSASESRDFFDEEDTPPWDTWICCYREPLGPGGATPFYDNLLCWIPPQLTDLADAGVQINPVDCIRWAEKDNSAYIARLRAAGLLG